MKEILSAEAMGSYGAELAKEYKILLLDWSLGAGKTTLTKGYAAALGIDPHKVQSPTYAYLNVYDDKLLHIDMYRLESFEDLVEKGILNQIAEYEYIVIEWPKRIDQLDLDNALHLEILKGEGTKRTIVFH